jgi:hypothetical protein
MNPVEKLKTIAAELTSEGWRQVYCFTDKSGWLNIKLEHEGMFIMMTAKP